MCFDISFITFVYVVLYFHFYTFYCIIISFFLCSFSLSFLHLIFLRCPPFVSPFEIFSYQFLFFFSSVYNVMNIMIYFSRAIVILVSRFFFKLIHNSSLQRYITLRNSEYVFLQVYSIYSTIKRQFLECRQETGYRSKILSSEGSRLKSFLPS